MATNDPKSGKNKSLFRNQSPTARWKQLEDWSDEKKFLTSSELEQIQKFIKSSSYLVDNAVTPDYINLKLNNKRNKIRQHR